MFAQPAKAALSALTISSAILFGSAPLASAEGFGRDGGAGHQHAGLVRPVDWHGGGRGGWHGGGWGHGGGHGGVRFGVGLGFGYPYWGPAYGYAPYAYPVYGYPVYAAPAVVDAPYGNYGYQPVPAQIDRSNCREYQSSAIVNGASQAVSGVACQQPDGTWRIVQ